MYLCVIAVNVVIGRYRNVPKIRPVMVLGRSPITKICNLEIQGFLLCKDENGECIGGTWDWTDYCLVGAAVIFVMRFLWMVSPPGQRGKEFPLDRYIIFYVPL
jgi:hypothetical protein